MIIIPTYAPTTETEEDEITSFYISIQEDVYYRPKQDMLIITGD